MTATSAKEKLNALASPEKAAASAPFLHIRPGEYGEGDKLIGVRVPDLRKLAREFQNLPISEIGILLHSAVHEERKLALLILVLGLNKHGDDHRKVVYDFYLANTRHVNNWDLVDASAPAIVGGYLRDKPRKPLLRLAKSPSLWERRIAVVATQHFIRLGEFADTLALSRLLLNDKEDLIHKATGWMLREVGERDQGALVAFLDQHAATMPRTMLRYAIEKFTPEKRRAYLEAGRPARGTKGDA